MSEPAASSSSAGSACAKAEQLSTRGTVVLHKLMNTVSTLLAIGSGKTERPALGMQVDPELLKLKVEERYSKLYEQYLQQSRELREIVSLCSQHGSVLEAAVAEARAVKETGLETPEDAALRLKAESLRQQVREKNAAVKEVMDDMMQLLNDMTMW
eukprot:CAMPEP_0177763262 /NCGR_PEP_ID=MMETSP0491_2-20121128/6779_1 /TAXON_ID=63592 /ORGANISM="Tetraselmis chuii, Strain PLY429" /LENGTH=155 /DNA_ID=CAMNT_0019279361 /DNA_START=358 /DNA_END=822 /DNA_ORIENTATION=-